MKTTIKILLLAVVVFVGSCNQTARQHTSGHIAGAIYYNGDIITMEGDQAKYAEALAIREGNILYVGTKEEAFKFQGDETIMKDLEGKTLVPGFIDGHAHFSLFGTQAITANLLAPPDGNVNTIDELLNELATWHTKNGTDKTNGWIVGMGFDDANLKEKRFPTKDDLDKVSKDIPVMITHISAHFAAVNSKGLEVLGITADTPEPPGGVIRRVKGGKEPNGVLEELAAIPYMSSVITPQTAELADL